mgnify:CR=1 FL=1
MGDMKDITEKSYDYEESVSLAQAHGYAINPIQYITSEIQGSNLTLPVKRAYQSQRGK